MARRMGAASRREERPASEMGGGEAKEARLLDQVVKDGIHAAAHQVGLVPETGAARIAAFAIMEQILAEEAPYIPLFHLNRVHLVHPSVRGWKENRFGQVDWRQLWIEVVP